MNGENAPSFDPEQPDQALDPSVTDGLEDLSVETTADEAPDVDELEDRLRDVEEAMAQLQSAELDTAERSIEALERRITGGPD